jgi:ElaB/YqjD/DUF883 family membrane-anchored ribosome-binding protein
MSFAETDRMKKTLVDRIRAEIDPDVNEPLDRLLEEAADAIEGENSRLRAFMERALDACRNAGRGNEIVAERVIERVEEELLSGLGRDGYDG